MKIEKEYRATEVSGRLGISHRTLLNWIKKGHIKAYKHIDSKNKKGTPWYIRESELNKFLSRGENNG